MAAPPKPTEEPETIIRYAESDDDVIAMHRFLLIVALPAMHCEADVEKSLIEVIRVTKHEAAIMAIRDGMLVGTMGIIKPVWWYGNGEFLTDRWDFTLPQFWHGEPHRMLIAEAHKIAEAAELKFFHQGKARKLKDGSYLYMPRIFTPESVQPVTQGSA